MDHRLSTFLTLCREGNYTKTADVLFMTQPAVTQHIQYLEKQYGTKLFERGQRPLRRTEKGEKLYQYALSLQAADLKMQEIMREPEHLTKRLKFGATLSIGAYVMPPVLEGYLQDHDEVRLTMEVENTQTLLSRLREGTLDFALVEGAFDKSSYGYSLLKREQFVAVCAADYPLPKGEQGFGKLLETPLILREPGSGTRDILEEALRAEGLSLGSFRNVTQVGDFRAIRYLVSRGLGVTFAYRPVVCEELECGKFRQIQLTGFPLTREFNFVYLKGSMFWSEYETFFDYCKRKLAGPRNHDE